MQREKQRAAVLSALFGFGFLLAILVLLLFDLPDLDFHNLPIAIGFLGFLGLYEFIIAVFFKYLITKQNKPASPIGNLANAFIEISIISLALFCISDGLPTPVVVLYTPIVWMYFYFIILSTLHLNFFLSLFTGSVAAVQYLALGFLFLRSEQDPTLPLLMQHHVMFVIKTCILLFSGLAAGYVARQIQQSIQRSIEMLEQQNRIVNLFGQQISREVVSEMLRQNGSLTSSLQRVTVMFIDIRGFTSYAETRTPQEVADYQNAFFGVIIDVVNQHHGIINQLLGDGCMITFGAPVPLENSTQNAVQAGLDILSMIEQKVKSGLIPPTRLGIGLHVGEAVTGNIGNETRQQYSITGNVVITASRIEQLNKQYNSQMLVSADVVEALPKDFISTEWVGLVPLKGRQEKISLYRLV
ncbi:MAG: adenylate/guanylate cyclase domain-containing protein [Bacteroidota bacterium]